MSDKTFLSFNREGGGGKTILQWWHWLDEHRGDRAELRRCRSPMDVCLLPAFSRLLWQLNDDYKINTDGLAIVAGLAAHINADTPAKSFGSQLSAGKPGHDNPHVSDLRFRRLLKIEERDELYTDMVRVIKLLERSADLCHLANNAYWWNDRTRKQIALDYYGGAFQKNDKSEKEEN